jgi:hypothetical protein
MEFDEFARRELPRLLRYAVVLTGDREAVPGNLVSVPELYKIADGIRF